MTVVFRDPEVARGRIDDDPVICELIGRRAGSGGNRTMAERSGSAMPSEAFPPIGAACGATRPPGNDVYIVVVGETTRNGEFTVEHDGVDTWFEHPGADAREGTYFSVPEATPASSVWSDVFVSAGTSASAVKLPPDTTTGSVSFHWQLVIGDAVATTVVIPPLTP